MAFLILDDGYPDSEEYQNNHIYFDEKNPQSFRRAIALLKQYTKDKQKTELSPKLSLDKKREI